MWNVITETVNDKEVYFCDKCYNIYKEKKEENERKHGTVCCKCKKDFSQDDTVTTHKDSKGKTHYYCDTCIAIIEKKEHNAPKHTVKNEEKEDSNNVYVNNTATSETNILKNIFIGIGIFIIILWMIGGCSSDNTNGLSESSSGQMCTVIKTVANDGTEKTSGTRCPTGEYCTKSTRDLDGDGSVCTSITASDGVVIACDGSCV